MYSVKDASEKLSLSPVQVRRLLRKGDIKGQKLGRDWVVFSLEPGMYSVKETAARLDLSPSQVRRLLSQGKIKGNKLARDWVVVNPGYKRRKKITSRN